MMAEAKPFFVGEAVVYKGQAALIFARRDGVVDLVVFAALSVDSDWGKHEVFVYGLKNIPQADVARPGETTPPPSEALS